MLLFLYARIFLLFFVAGNFLRAARTAGRVQGGRKGPERVEDLLGVRKEAGPRHVRGDQGEARESTVPMLWTGWSSRGVYE